MNEVPQFTYTAGTVVDIVTPRVEWMRGTSTSCDGMVNFLAS